MFHVKHCSVQYPGRREGLAQAGQPTIAAARLLRLAKRLAQVGQQQQQRGGRHAFHAGGLGQGGRAQRFELLAYFGG